MYCHNEGNTKMAMLTKEQILISIDRLTRFKSAEVKYLRVYKDIVLHNLIEPSFSKNDLDNMDYEKLRDYAQEVFNFSIKKVFGKISSDLSINKELLKYENSVSYLNDKTINLIDNKFDYKSCIEFIDKKSVPNLIWIKSIKNNADIKKERQKLGFRFPIEMVILVEGATEETLLPEFAKLCDFDFDKNGVFIIPAGGKNQVVKLYYEICDLLKLPIYILLDKDGVENAKEISHRLKPKDKIHIIECGEFEDLLSNDLVERTLKLAFNNISLINDDIIPSAGHRVEYLEEIFKHRGMHEFKKVEFSQLVKENIHSKSDVTSEIFKIMDEIKMLKSNS